MTNDQLSGRFATRAKNEKTAQIYLGFFRSVCLWRIKPKIHNV